MPTFHVLVLLTLLLQSSPDLGDAFRVEPKRKRSRIRSGDEFRVQPMRNKSRIQRGHAFGVQPMRNKYKNLSAEQENCTCGNVLPYILSRSLTEVTKELRRTVKPDRLAGLIIGRLDKIKERVERSSVPCHEYSLSYSTNSDARDKLSTGERGATELAIFPGGYTVSPLWGIRLGNVRSKFTRNTIIQHIPSSEVGESRLIAYTIYGGRPNSKRVLVWCHGSDGNIEQVGTLAKSMGLALKAVVVGFEYPSYGDPDSDMESTTVGHSTLESVRFVTLAGLNWIRQVWGVAEKNIYIAGQSIGTGAATETAWEYEVKAGKPLGGLILVSPLSSVQTMLSHSDSVFQTSQHLSEMSLTPIFAVHSPIDTMQNVISAENRKNVKVMFLGSLGKGFSLFGNYSPKQMDALFGGDKFGFETWIKDNRPQPKNEKEKEKNEEEEGDVDIDLEPWDFNRDPVFRLVTPERLAETASCGACDPRRPSTR